MYSNGYDNRGYYGNGYGNRVYYGNGYGNHGYYGNGYDNRVYYGNGYDNRVYYGNGYGNRGYYGNSYGNRRYYRNGYNNRGYYSNGYGNRDYYGNSNGSQGYYQNPAPLPLQGDVVEAGQGNKILTNTMSNDFSVERNQAMAACSEALKQLITAIRNYAMIAFQHGLLTGKEDKNDERTIDIKPIDNK